MSAFRSIESLVGQELSSVEFGRNYLKLSFDGPFVTLFLWPVLDTSEFSLNFEDLLYRNGLCERIGRRIVEVVTDDPDFIFIRFEDASSLHCSLERKAGRGPGYFKPLS